MEDEISVDMYYSWRSIRRLKKLAPFLASSVPTSQPARSGPSKPTRTNWAFRLSLVGVLFLVPADLFVSYSVISNFGFFAHIETGALGSVFFVLSLGTAIPVATLLLHFDPRQRVAWGIILVASSSVLGFLSVAAELIDYGGSGSVASNNWLLTLGVTSIEIGCLLTFVGGILAIATL